MTANRHELVLVVDDDEAVRDSVAFLLRAEGYTVRTYTSGEELLENLDDGARGCVLLDIRLGGVDGLELARRIKAMDGPPVILMTGELAPPAKAMAPDVVDVLDKPLADHALVDCVKRALGLCPDRS